MKKPVILYFGHIGIEETIGIRPHRREFFDTLFALAEIVNKIDGVLFVKPRANLVDIRKMSIAEKLPKTHYKPIWKNPRIIFINTQYPVYQYMFADIVVSNGYSTTGVEAVIADKPVLKVNLIGKPLIKDYYKTLENNAALEATSKDDILLKINAILGNSKVQSALKVGREQYISKYNLLVDGKASERILDRIIKLSDPSLTTCTSVCIEKPKSIKPLEATKMRETQQKLWASQSDAVIKEYWDFSGELGLRTEWFAKQLHNYDFNSIYEVGMFSGRNLYKIQSEFSNVKIGGCDINDDAIKFAKDKLPNAEILYESIYELDESKKWDIVFTMGVLIHVPQDGFELAINKLIAKANKYVIHVERLGEGVTINGPKELNPARKVRDKFMWYPNLEKAYNNLGFDVTKVALPKSVCSGDLTLVAVKL